MKRVHISPRVFIITGVVLLVISVQAFIWTSSRPASSQGGDHVRGQRAAEFVPGRGDKRQMAQKSSGSTPPSSAFDSRKSSSGALGQSKPSAVADEAIGSTEACRHFNTSEAKTILGGDAALVTAASTDVADDADVQVSTCQYAAGSGTTRWTVTLTDHMAKTALGVSLNSVVFGSGRPESAQAVLGFGQMAYWDDAKHELEILQNNAWYSLASGHGDPAKPDSLDQVTQAANVIVPTL